jgi:hypothetical protein
MWLLRSESGEAKFSCCFTERVDSSVPGPRFDRCRMRSVNVRRVLLMETDARLHGVNSSDAISAVGSGLERTMDAALRLGLPVFALANIALGVETLVGAHLSVGSGRYVVIPILPFLPPIPWLAYVFGVIWVACSAGLLFRGSMRTAAMALGSLLFVSTLVLEVPRYATELGNMGSRTGVFEPLAMATLAWLLPGPGTIPGWLVRLSRYLLMLALVVFGVDHFLGLAFIASLLPNWIPWHLFWVAFFGAGFIAAGLSIGFDFLERWGATGLGLMFAIWVFTLHLPRVLGLYGIPGAPHSPAEWSSLFIAVALWGGPWALARQGRSDLVAGE